MMMNDIKIIALVGKAGSGKDTLLQKAISRYPNKLHEIISCTTRPPRENEVDGKNYHFLSVEDFTKKLLTGDLLEATEFNQWHYGTSLSSLSKEKVNIGVFNIDGIICLQDHPNIDLTTIYITCPDKERLLRQLNREINPNIDEIIRRYHADQQDFLNIEEEIYEFFIFKNETPSCFEDFLTLIGLLS